MWIALALVCAVSGAHAVPAVTVTQLVHHPYRYAHQIVRITGEVDNCISFDCALCPPHRIAGDGQICVGLAFSGFSDDAAGRQTALLMEEAFRFATVEMLAWFEPGCLQSYQAIEEKRHPNLVMVCTDRATVLYDARVTKVISRKSVLDGMVGPYVDGKLAEPPDSELRAMQTEASYWREKGDTASHGIFVISSPPPVETWQAWGVYCVCRAGDCAGRWPVKWDDGFDSPANPFACDLMIKKDGNWRLVPK
ncbi:MAG: hypothetical protein ACREHE_15140 [Rhizomicrobium sp.]